MIQLWLKDALLHAESCASVSCVLAGSSIQPYAGYEVLACDVQRADVRPQSLVLLNVPCVSAAQWHPFTVAAVRPVEGATLAELHIKPRGKWARVSPFVSSLHWALAAHRPYHANPPGHLLHAEAVQMLSDLGVTVLAIGQHPHTAYMPGRLERRMPDASSGLQAVVREIVRHGATAVKVDGPYGGLQAPVGTAPPYVLLIAGGIGVSPGCMWLATHHACMLAPAPCTVELCMSSHQFIARSITMNICPGTHAPCTPAGHASAGHAAVAAAGTEHCGSCSGHACAPGLGQR